MAPSASLEGDRCRLCSRSFCDWAALVTLVLLHRRMVSDTQSGFDPIGSDFGDSSNGSAVIEALCRQVGTESVAQGPLNHRPDS